MSRALGLSKELNLAQSFTVDSLWFILRHQSPFEKFAHVERCPVFGLSKELNLAQSFRVDNLWFILRHQSPFEKFAHVAFGLSKCGKLSLKRLI